MLWEVVVIVVVVVLLRLTIEKVSERESERGLRGKSFCVLKFGFLGVFYRGQNTRGLMIWSLFFGGCVRKQRSRERDKEKSGGFLMGCHCHFASYF